MEGKLKEVEEVSKTTNLKKYQKINGQRKTNRRMCKKYIQNLLVEGWVENIINNKLDTEKGRKIKKPTL